MRVEIKIERGHISLSINETTIPFISEILRADEVNIFKTGENTFEFECEGVNIVEDETFKTLHVTPIRAKKRIKHG